MHQKNVMILNGPNLNMLGTREPNIYGTETLADIENMCLSFADANKIKLIFKQSNSEAELIDLIHSGLKLKISDIIINAGAYTHTSVAIMDALLSVNITTYEVHLSNIFAREEFRSKSYISKIAKAVISGFGSMGYTMALQYIIANKK